jgi:REP element-mobilizing transposase RayT
MARPLRIEFAGAIYHVMARGNGRQRLFHGDDDYQRMLDGLEKTVLRTGWEVFSFVWMPNHIHLFLRTPQPNLSRGMQYLLSGYANWYAKRHQRPGHLFQGRFKGELVEDESYFWTVSRYLHLNPVRGKRPLVAHPRDWRWSSYSGYARKTARLDWMCYDALYAAWQGEMGGGDPVPAYRRFVESGIESPPANPLAAAREGWLLGGEKFAARIKRMLKQPRNPDEVPQWRRFERSPADVVEAVAEFYGISVESYSVRRSQAPGRDLAAYLVHRRTTATLREVAALFGLGHPDSASNLIRRADKALAQSTKLRLDLEKIERRLYTC